MDIHLQQRKRFGISRTKHKPTQSSCELKMTCPNLARLMVRPSAVHPAGGIWARPLPLPFAFPFPPFLPLPLRAGSSASPRCQPRFNPGAFSVHHFVSRQLLCNFFKKVGDTVASKNILKTQDSIGPRVSLRPDLCIMRFSISAICSLITGPTPSRSSVKKSMPLPELHRKLRGSAKRYHGY